jgi:hypothetical protein
VICELWVIEGNGERVLMGIGVWKMFWVMCGKRILKRVDLIRWFILIRMVIRVLKLDKGRC